MSVENVPTVVHVKALKGRFIPHKFSTGWVSGVVKGVQKIKSVAGQFAIKYSSRNALLGSKTKQGRFGAL
jgi:hypothetical protein